MTKKGAPVNLNIIKDLLLSWDFRRVATDCAISRLLNWELPQGRQSKGAVGRRQQAGQGLELTTEN
jgi:hypothetical protein